METAEHIAALRAQGAALGRAARCADPAATVPACPGWRVPDLVRHQGQVHRWATGYLTERRLTPVPIEDVPTPPDAALHDWYDEGFAALLDALESAPADLECWSFLAGSPSPVAFWARRQAHETAVHRVDAEAALGSGAAYGTGTDAGSGAGAGFDAAFAADGVDELLRGFHARERSRVRTDPPRTLHIRALDAPAGAPGGWLVRLSADHPRTELTGADAEPGAPADCTVTGTAAALYLALWNRGPYEALEVGGDASLLELWRRTGAIV
jgi:uncharacterized protein (TIGR03083 family)